MPSPSPAEERYHEVFLMEHDEQSPRREAQAANNVNVEAIDYLPPDSYTYRAWLRTQPAHRAWAQTALFVLIGAMVGLTAFGLTGFIDALSFLKVYTVRVALRHRFVGLAWFFNACYSIGLVALSAEVVLRFAPAAAGSGVPEVMAHLNGCKLPRVFEWRTAAVKFVSAALCVGSGLPVGPEGPIIFLGAAIGGLMSQGTGFLRRSRILRRLWPFGRFRNSKDKRDFCTAGCAAGVAAAFGAPIGGLLFVFEDVASFWNKTMGWQVFVSCMFAVFAHAMAASIRHGDLLARDAILFEVTRPVKMHALASGVAIVIGAACGLAAAAFTWATLVWDTRVRSRLVGAKRWRRLAEPCVYMLLFLTFAIVVPFAFPCRESGCIAQPDGGLACRNDSAIARDLYGSGEGMLRERAVEESVETFTCRASRAETAAPFLPPSTTDGGANANHSIPGRSLPLPRPDDGTPPPQQRRYNELATLAHVTGEDAIRHLFSRGTHLEFGYGALATFYLLYSTFAALAAGSCISSGLLVPFLLMGAIIGRFCGLVSVDLATRWGYSAADLLATDEWAWIDPGVFAVVGAGAFLGGGMRQALSVTVIVVEMTSEVHFLLPIMLATATAKWVSEALQSHGLYHAILRNKGVPFLPSEPPAGLPLETSTVCEVMASGPVVCVPETGLLSSAASALRRGGYHAFPVVRACEGGDILVGIVPRDHLRRVVARALETPVGAAMRPLSFYELEGKASVSGVRPPSWPADDGEDASDDELDEGEGERGTPLLDSPSCGAAAAAVVEDASWAMQLDLRPYVNRSNVSVPQTFSAQRTYLVFRTLGLRHMPVVDEHNHVVGMVTRKELLKERLRARLATAAES